MSTHKHIDKICGAVLVLVLLLTAAFINAGAFGIETIARTMGYESKLFDTSAVHTIDIVMEDWDAFVESCSDEEYVNCTVVIDNEAYKNVAIRAKGNTSLTQVQAYGNNRYSFKIEFDHYDSTQNYYGLDKLCLNNIIQDNTYMKDYLTYQMMGYFGVDAPLCSYVYITVNGEDWGLYLAVESVEESFLQRNYGNDYGELYKPDSTDMGGGRGNGENFNMGQQMDNTSGDMGQIMDNTFGGMGQMMGSDDVTLVYSDDDYDSYSNIFNNAKTDISDSDKDRLIASLKKLNENEDIEDVVDIEEVIRYFVVHNFVVNFDSYTGSMIHNYYLYEKDGQMSMIPWDYNLAFGGFMSASDADSLVNYPIDTPVSGGTVDSRPMLAWIFANEEYTQLYHQYFERFISEYFDSGYFESMIDSVKELIAPYVEKDPTKFCTCEEFEAGVSTLKEFCLLRAQSVCGQLDGTIASTSDGQAQDKSSLVDAGDLEISDMGTMGNNMAQGGGPENGMGRMGGQKFGMEQGESSVGDAPEVPGGKLAEVPVGDAPGLPVEDAPEVPDGELSELSEGAAETQPGDTAGELPENGMPMQGERRAADFDQENIPVAVNGKNIQGTDAGNDGEKWILLGISAGVLLVGLVIAGTFKRR